MKLTILCVGRIKESYLAEGIAEYQKRMSRYAKVEMIETPDEKTPEGAGGREQTAIKAAEGERLLHYLNKTDAYVIALAIEGKQMDSESFSERLERLGVNGTSHIIFVIGGSLGLDDRVLTKADLRLSFSNMTFPHQMMRMILLEQIYRAYRIMRNEPYHK